MGCDAVWVMDDDTIPYTDSLCKLCEVLEEHSSVGFLGSKVIWKDGTDHIMNMPKFVSLNDECQNVREITSSTFVSMLITSKAIKSVGLPFKEFFIWGDDVEYSNRIIRYGYKGLYVRDSVVIHKTTENYGPDLSNAPIETAWKFYYGRRNDMYIRRARYGYGLLFYIKELNHLRLALHNLSKRPKEQQAAFLKNVIRGFREGLTFRPEVEFV